MPEKKADSQQEGFPWYTGTGDDGTTQLLGNQRVPKYSQQPDTYGIVDEATSALGLARALINHHQCKNVIVTIQRHLYRMMSEIAATPENRDKYRFLEKEHVDWLSQTIDVIGDKIEMPRDFIIPGDSAGGGALDLARAVVRRAERAVLKAQADGIVINPAIPQYFNRLSSLCYVMARHEDIVSGSGKVTLAKDEPSGL